MGLKILLEGASALGSGVWSAMLSPSELASWAGPNTPKSGAVNVVLLSRLRSPARDAELLSFEPSQARVLNLGTSGRTVVIFGDEEGTEGDEDQIVEHKFGPGVQQDDGAFLEDLSSLPSELATAGRALLEGMRKEFGGYFQRTRIGRYVNRPNNFWTVKIQPRDRSLRITVRGAPHRLPRTTIPVQPDRNGYSTFKIDRPEQLDDALRLLQAAVGAR
jgi:hypothetical protein